MVRTHQRDIRPQGPDQYTKDLTANPRNGTGSPFQWYNPFGSAIRLWSGVDLMTITSAGNVGIGTINPTYTLSVNGTIGAKDVMVTNAGWSDYVFRPGYRLRPLAEVAAFIRQNQHLPDIPSESEVKEKGVSVGEMQAKLLAKIEELTLHLIGVMTTSKLFRAATMSSRDPAGEVHEITVPFDIPVTVVVASSAYKLATEGGAVLNRHSVTLPITVAQGRTAAPIQVSIVGRN